MNRIAENCRTILRERCYNQQSKFNNFSQEYVNRSKHFYFKLR